jgi:hypothetical protein
MHVAITGSYINRGDSIKRFYLSTSKFSKDKDLAIKLNCSTPVSEVWYIEKGEEVFEEIELKVG